MKTTDQYSFNDQPGIAVFIAGALNSQKPREFIAAWQYLYDSGMYLRLQGWYGRRIQDMIREGHTRCLIYL